MALTNAFHEAVASGNVRRVRIMMKDSLLVDPSFREFDTMDRAAHSLSGLYDVHDNRDFQTDESQWTDEYMDKLMVQVVNNFSHERIEHLKAVVRKLRPVAIPRASDAAYRSTQSRHESKEAGKRQTSSYEEQKKKDQIEGRYLGAKVATGAVVGAFAGGVVAGVASASVVAGACIGAAVGGATISVIEIGGRKR